MFGSLKLYKRVSSKEYTIKGLDSKKKPVTQESGDKELFLAPKGEHQVSMIHRDRWDSLERENEKETRYNLGMDYYKREDYATAHVWLYSSLLDDHGPTQQILGDMNRLGRGVSKDYKVAMKKYKKAVSLGEVEAGYGIGCLYRDGLGVKVDYKKAMKWHMQTAQLPAALFSIGCYYHFGLGVTKDIHIAIEWYTKAANRGNIDAQYNLGLIYVTENEVMDLQKAINWYQKAADKDHQMSLIDVKKLNKQGYYAKEEGSDEKSSNKVLSSEALHKEELYSALKNDMIIITEEEIQKARENDKYALYNIGAAYYDNEDYTEALEWFLKAAIHGHDHAQYRIGRMYRHGRGVPKDLTLAMDWYQKASSNGNADAQCNIGVLYQNGLGIARDFQQAMYWYMRAAGNGCIDAMIYIGRLYRKGRGVIKNNHIAIEWFEKAAANQSSTKALYHLGLVYEEEDEVRDIQKAIQCYQLAVDMKHEKAKTKVKELNHRGYYYAKDEKKEEQINAENSISVSVADIAGNEQMQYSSSTINNDEHIKKLIDGQIKQIEDAFQKKLNILQQEQIRKDEENKQLKEKLAQWEAGLHDNAENDIIYEPSDNSTDNEYDSACNTEYNCSDQDDDHSTSKNIYQNNFSSNSGEIYADPYYNSSDNEDPIKDIYYDK